MDIMDLSFDFASTSDKRVVIAVLYGNLWNCCHTISILRIEEKKEWNQTTLSNDKNTEIKLCDDRDNLERVLLHCKIHEHIRHELLKVCK